LIYGRYWVLTGGAVMVERSAWGMARLKRCPRPSAPPCLIRL
jgi:hypothetical protein